MHRTPQFLDTLISGRQCFHGTPLSVYMGVGISGPMSFPGVGIPGTRPLPGEYVQGWVFPRVDSGGRE